MKFLRRHGPRIAVTLLPVVLALWHATLATEWAPIHRMDAALYDIRLRATMPGTRDERIVIVDIDERSLEEIGHWPWGRDKVAQLVDELFDRQKAAVLGMDVLFAEADQSSGLANLRQLADGPLRGQPGFAERLRQLEPVLDYDGRFARSLADRPVALGYYFTSDRDGRTKGVLPAPVMRGAELAALARGQGPVVPPLQAYAWSGYGANLEGLVSAVPQAGFFNSITDADGVVRSVPVIAQYQGHYYESLAMAMFRLVHGRADLLPVLVPAPEGEGGLRVIEKLLLQTPGALLPVRVDANASTLVPYRGPGGARGGSFSYVSASAVLKGQLPAGSLQGKIALLGSTAPGLLDLRVTPVGETYPGVETHANVISGWLDGRSLIRPDYANGYDAAALLLAGLVLALALPFLSVLSGSLLTVAIAGVLAALNFWFYRAHGLVMPVAAQLIMVIAAFTLNIGYGYFVESRSRRQLARLFGSYVPRELVREMVKDPESYTMQAVNREMTVMFCDMRGFTTLSEQMEPLALQALLNTVFSRLTRVIRKHRGTIDKYMGDCVMAFWGAPVETPHHARLAVAAALDMVEELKVLNAEHRQRGLPEIGIGIGINTGTMCVGDMGSYTRRSYTVIGDAVNLGARLESLSKLYGVQIVVGDHAQAQAADLCAWRELDRVVVRGRQQAVTVYMPLPQVPEHDTWPDMLRAYRECRWNDAAALLALQPVGPALRSLYASRIDAARQWPPRADWDGAYRFDSR